MGLLFGRRANVLIKGPNSPQGRVLSGLRTVFSVTKSNDPTANAAEIIVYNMNQDSITFAKQTRSQIVLAVGYDEGMPTTALKVIFSGDIYRQTTNKQDDGIVTKFENADSLRAFQDAKINRSYKGGTSVTQVLDHIVDAVGLIKGSIQGLSGKQFSSGYSAFGDARAQLDVIAKKTDTIWSVQDGVLQFIPLGGSTPDPVILLTSDTGLVGSPNQKMLKVGQSEVQGVECISLLQPEIRPGRKIEIRSEFIEGRFTVQKVTHRGDTSDGPWYSEIEAI